MQKNVLTRVLLRQLDLNTNVIRKELGAALNELKLLKEKPKETQWDRGGVPSEKLYNEGRLEEQKFDAVFGKLPLEVARDNRRTPEIEAQVKEALQKLKKEQQDRKKMLGTWTDLNLKHLDTCIPALPLEWNEIVQKIKANS